MSSLFVLFKSAIIGAIGGLITYLIDLSRGRTVSYVMAVTKVLCGSFVSYAATPSLLRLFNTSDEGFIAAVLGILGYKLVEWLLSEGVFKKIKDRLIYLLTK